MFIKEIDDTLKLRILGYEHTDELYQLTIANRPYLQEWLPWIGEMTTVHHTKQFIEASLKKFAGNTGINCGIFYEDRMAGCIGFHGHDWQNLKTSLGYWLAEPYQGKGIMTQSCRTMIDYAIEELGMNRIEIRAAVGNVKSKAIAERLHFKHEGVLRQVEKVGDRFIDHDVYSMVAEEWVAACTIS